MENAKIYRYAPLSQTTQAVLLHSATLCYNKTARAGKYSGAYCADRSLSLQHQSTDYTLSDLSLYPLNLSWLAEKRIHLVLGLHLLHMNELSPFI